MMDNDPVWCCTKGANPARIFKAQRNWLRIPKYSPDLMPLDRCVFDLWDSELATFWARKHKAGTAPQKNSDAAFLTSIKGIAKRVSFKNRVRALVGSYREHIALVGKEPAVVV